MSSSSLYSSITESYYDLKDTRDSDAVDLVGIGSLAKHSLRLLAEEAEYRHFADMDDRSYWIFEVDGNLSRPVRPDLMISDDTEFEGLWQEVRKACRANSDQLEHDRLNEVLYTAVTSYASVKDLKSGDRTSPGIFFEIIIESMVEVLTGLTRGAGIGLSSGVRIPIDMHFHDGEDGERKYAIPTKNSLRERYSQAYVHQHLLEQVQEDENLAEFRTSLISIGDTQRAGDGVKFTCTPGQLKLYHKHVTQLDAFYYLDPPQPYTREAPIDGGNGGDLEIKKISEFFSDDLPGYVNWIKGENGEADDEEENNEESN